MVLLQTVDFVQSDWTKADGSSRGEQLVRLRLRRTILRSFSSVHNVSYLKSCCFVETGNTPGQGHNTGVSDPQSKILLQRDNTLIAQSSSTLTGDDLWPCCAPVYTCVCPDRPLIRVHNLEVVTVHPAQPGTTTNSLLERKGKRSNEQCLIRITRKSEAGRNAAAAALTQLSVDPYCDKIAAHRHKPVKETTQTNIQVDGWYDVTCGSTVIRNTTP